MKYTPEKITHLEPHQIIVFGSNTEGRHGRGLAKFCLDNFGAIYGQAKGLQGQSYAIVTKDLTKGEKSVPLEEIYNQLVTLKDYALDNQEKEFLVTKIGTGLAGYSEIQIKNILAKIKFPYNVILPKL